MAKKSSDTKLMDLLSKVTGGGSEEQLQGLSDAVIAAVNGGDKKESGMDLEALIGGGKSTKSRKSTGDSIIDIISGLAAGKGVDINDIIDAASGAASSSSKKSSGSKKKDEGLLDKIFNKRDDYPQWSEKTYWAIREKFAKSIPEKVTASTLTNATGLKADTVKTTILPALEVLGLTKDGAPTTKLKSWVNDSKYEDACASILSKAYPDDLCKLPVKTETQKNAVIKWFQKNAGASETNAKKMATVFCLLAAPELKTKAAPAAKAPASKATKSESTESSAASSVKSGVTVTKKGSKATVIIKFTVDDSIGKREFTQKVAEYIEQAYAKIQK